MPDTPVRKHVDVQAALCNPLTRISIYIEPSEQNEHMHVYVHGTAQLQHPRDTVTHVCRLKNSKLGNCCVCWFANLHPLEEEIPRIIS